MIQRLFYSVSEIRSQIGDFFIVIQAARIFT